MSITNCSSKLFACPDSSSSMLFGSLFLVLVLVPSYLLVYILFYAVCLFLVPVLVPRLVIKKNCPTRGLSLFLVICRMLEVKNLTTVLEEFEWENMNVVQWKH